MKRWSPKTQALVGGLIGSAVTFGVLAWRKKSELEARAALLESAGPGAQDELARQAAALQAELGEFGERYTEAVAQRTAERYIGEVYGLTPRRIERLTQLAEVF